MPGYLLPPIYSYYNMLFHNQENSIVAAATPTTTLEARITTMAAWRSLLCMKARASITRWCGDNTRSLLLFAKHGINAVFLHGSCGHDSRRPLSPILASKRSHVARNWGQMCEWAEFRTSLRVCKHQRIAQKAKQGDQFDSNGFLLHHLSCASSSLVRTMESRKRWS